MDPDEYTRQLAAEGDPTAWFDQLYLAADQGETTVPWDRGTPNALLVEWADRRQLRGPGRAMVVGAGYGRDSEYIVTLGFDTVAFDISPAAVEATRKRFPDSPVDYVAADLLALPGEWAGAFDLVIESMNVQALPDPPRRPAIEAVGTMVAPGGTLIVIAIGTGGGDPAEGPPWPLTREEIDAFATGDLEPVGVEEIYVEGDPDIPRWRVEFQRP